MYINCNFINYNSGSAGAMNLCHLLDTYGWLMVRFAELNLRKMLKRFGSVWVLYSLNYNYYTSIRPNYFNSINFMVQLTNSSLFS